MRSEGKLWLVNFILVICLLNFPSSYVPRNDEVKHILWMSFQFQPMNILRQLSPAYIVQYMLSFTSSVMFVFLSAGDNIRWCAGKVAGAGLPCWLESFFKIKSLKVHLLPIYSSIGPKQMGMSISIFLYDVF